MARRSRRSRRGDDSQGFAWMLLGLCLGLVVAAGVYFSGWRAGDAPDAVSAAARGATPRAPAGDEASSGGLDARAAQPSTADSAPARATEQRFDFYEILPQSELVVPEVETVTRTSAPPAAVAAPGNYILQTGSFRSHSDADRMQASLALLGIESRIQKVTIDADVFHRVRVGPISDLEQLNRLRAQLSGAGVDSLMMKVNE